MSNKPRTALPIVLGMTILIVALVYGLFIRPNFYRVNGGMIEFDALQVGRLNGSLDEQVQKMGDYLYVASEEGLTKYNLEGVSIWNKSYHLNEMLFIVEEPYIAVVNLTGKNSYIFDENGSTAEVTTDYGIIGGYLSNHGYLTLVLENGQENYINLYDSMGNIRVERRTLFKNDGYPIDVAMTDDGTHMMTSHLDVSEHMVESIVTFLDYSSIGDEFEDKIIGHERLSDTMASELIFIDVTKAVVVGDNQLNFYTIDRTPSLLNEVPVLAEINYVAATENEVVISYGQAILPEGENQAYSVVVYSDNGVVKEQHQFDGEVTGLYGEDGTYYVVQSSKVSSYQSGEKIWETTVYKPLKGIYHINSDRYLLVYDHEYEVVEIRDL